MDCPACNAKRVVSNVTYPLLETPGRRKRYTCRCGKSFHTVEVNESVWRTLLAANARLQIIEARHA